MTVRVQVVFDCADPNRLAEFWAVALEYTLEPPPEGYDSWEVWATEQGIPESEWGSAASVVDPGGKGPRIYFQKVPERKVAKNRVHLDVSAGGPRGTPVDERRPRVASKVAELTAVGGTVVREVEESGQHWVVMQDPEGNEFCVQ